MIYKKKQEFTMITKNLQGHLPGAEVARVYWGTQPSIYCQSHAGFKTVVALLRALPLMTGLLLFTGMGASGLPSYPIPMNSPTLAQDDTFGAQVPTPIMYRSDQARTNTTIPPSSQPTLNPSIPDQFAPGCESYHPSNAEFEVFTARQREAECQQSNYGPSHAHNSSNYCGYGCGHSYIDGCSD